MNIEELREYALAFPNVSEGFPFGQDLLVFKVNGKIFLLVSLSDAPFSFNVKCDPEYAIELRELHTSIIPGYHMNKKHWNTVIMDGTLSSDFLKNLVTHSYELVVKKKR